MKLSTRDGRGKISSRDIKTGPYGLEEERVRRIRCKGGSRIIRKKVDDFSLGQVFRVFPLHSCMVRISYEFDHYSVTFLLDGSHNLCQVVIIDWNS